MSDELEEYFALRARWEEEERVRAAAPAPDPVAEAMSRPVESRSRRERRELAQRDSEWAEARAERERRQADTAMDWEARIDRKITAVAPVIHNHVSGVVAEMVAEFHDTIRRVDAEIALVRVEVTTLRTSNSELRVSNERLRQALITTGVADIIDMPNPLGRGNGTVN